jgi:hypothetical protein
MATKYRFSGRLCGYICQDSSEALSNVEVRLYRTRSDQDVTRLASASSKTTFTILSEKEVRAKEDSLIGVFKTDDDGAFEADLGREEGYDGEAFEIDVYCATVPGRRPTEKQPKPVQFSITVLQPDWRRDEGGVGAFWEYCIPHRYWCRIRGHFGAWTICGHLTTCDRPHMPVAGMRVSAFDADWLQPDALGSATTDASGKFRIDYLAPDFEKTIFSWLNVELKSGPDLYFRVETLGGDVLLDEPQTRGRASDRENVGPCFCVDLCVKEVPVVDHAWFTRVGNFDIVSDISSTDGLTKWPRPVGPWARGGPGYGFFGAINLVGDCPTHHPVGGEPMRYRFRTGPTGGSLTSVLKDQIVSSPVGNRPIQWLHDDGTAWLTWQTIVVADQVYPDTMLATDPQPAPAMGPIPPAILIPDSDGWVTVDPATNLGGMSGALMVLDTTSIVPGGVAPGAGAGNPVSDPKAGRHMQIVFEAEPVGGPTASSPTISNGLPNIYINNWDAVRLIDIGEFAGSCCTPLADSLTIMYTADHELMASWRVWLSSCALPGGSPVTLPSGSGPRGGAGKPTIDISDAMKWPACSYTLGITTTRALTDGIDVSVPQDASLTFCIDRP